MSTTPVLYSFRRCPYAIRARMAIARAGVSVELREVLLRDKPAAMLAISPKATVPVLVTAQGQVLDESLEIMRWALAQHDPDNWLADVSATLIETNDGSFKQALDRYKYADRYPQHSVQTYRAQGESILRSLEHDLGTKDWLCGIRPGFTDIAIFPFIRQFAAVDTNWFNESPYPRLRRWLNHWLHSSLFLDTMGKHPPWEPGQAAVPFP